MKITMTMIAVLISSSVLMAQGRPAATLGTPGGSAGGGFGAGSFAGGYGSGTFGGGFGSPSMSGGSNVSPYLNLFRGGGGNTAINYYGIVRPQMNLQTQIQGLQSSFMSSGNEQDIVPGSLVIGTRVRFLNTQPYFLNINGSGQGGAASPGMTVGAGGAGGASGFSTTTSTIGNRSGASSSNLGNSNLGGGVRQPMPAGAAPKGPNN